MAIKTTAVSKMNDPIYDSDYEGSGRNGDKDAGS